MVGRLHGLMRVGRQFSVAVLTIALLLQGVAFAFANERVAATAAGDIDQAAFALCLHGTAGSDQTGGAPELPTGDQHCIFCPAGTTYVLGTLASPPAFRTIAFAMVSWPSATWRLPTTTVDASARPRGPPLAL
jgi:hypothetical protein